MIHVCSLARLHETVEQTGARHVVTLLGSEVAMLRPAGIAPENHLWLEVHDIAAPVEGFIAPGLTHVEKLIAFVRRWDRTTPLVVHCHAGVSRSTAAAYIAACAIRPEGDEHLTARALRRASPTALPNVRMVAIGDDLLGRNGRMIAAIRALGPAALADAVPFRLGLD